MLTHLSLFSGIGGLDIAAEMAGFRTVGQCEWADYPTLVLERHWPDVPRWRDIRTLNAESFYAKTGLRTVDVISGGFPCQPFSRAGKRGGTGDDRYLWPEMCRVIRELRPAWVIGENVPGLVDLALDEVLADLEAIGYESQPFIVPACGVDAPHIRYRLCIVAHANGQQLGVTGPPKDVAGAARQEPHHGGRAAGAPAGEPVTDAPGPAGVADVLRAGVHGADADTGVNGLEGRFIDQILHGGGLRRDPQKSSGNHPAWENWPDESGIPRVADGIPHRVDRIRCLGNAVVPQQFYIFFRLIADIESQEDKREAQ